MAVVKKMMELQHEFVSWGEKSSANDEVKGKIYADSVVENFTIRDNDTEKQGSNDDDDVSSDLVVSEFQQEQAPYSFSSKKMQQEELAETLVELRRMGLRKNEDGMEKKRRRGRPRKGEPYIENSQS